MSVKEMDVFRHIRWQRIQDPHRGVGTGRNAGAADLVEKNILCRTEEGGRSLTLIDIADRFNFASISHFSRFVQNNLVASLSSFRE